MESIETDLYADAFAAWDMVEAASTHGYGPAGKLHELDNEIGRAEYWTYFRDNLFAINSFDFRFRKAWSMTYEHTEHISIGVYEGGIGSMFAEGRAVIPHTVQSYIADEGGTYRARWDEGTVMRGTSICISPDYYRDVLQARFGDIPDVRRAFALVDGAGDFHELVALFHEVRAYRGSGPAAELFYEGAVAKAIALVMDRARSLEADADRDAKGHVRISRRERNLMGCLASYIDEHLDEDLSCERLARRACMGQTKFKEVFGACFGRTPHAYVTDARMRAASELLADGELTVAEVAARVGYQTASAFARAYRAATGRSPSAARHR